MSTKELFGLPKFVNIPPGKPGYIYLMQGFDKKGSPIYKIGLSKNITQRLRNLKTGNTELTLLEFCPSRNMYETEKLFHGLLSEFRVDGEFFALDIDTLAVVRETFTDISNYYRYWQKTKALETQPE